MTERQDDRGVEVLFAHAYFLGDDRRPVGFMHPLPPGQPAAVAAWLEQQGIRVGLWDSTFRDDLAAFEIEISRRRPRVVWIYTHPTTRDDAHRMREIAARGGAATLAGGPDARVRPEAYLRRGFDAIVLGEGEVSTVEAVRALRTTRYRPDPRRLAHVPGLAFIDGDDLLRRSAGEERLVDMQDLPRPYRVPEDVRAHLERWLDHRRFRPLALESARGCPLPCGFCTHSVFGRPYRRRAPDDVVAEVRELQARYEADRLHFSDEVFAFDRHWLTEFAQAMDATGGPAPFEGSASPAALDADSLAALARAGCVRLELDAASGSDRLLRDLGWRYGPADAYRAASAIRDAGIALGLRVLAGLPGETRADLDATMEMVRVIEPDGVEVTRVDPGSPALFRKNWERIVAGPLAERARAEGTLPPRVLDAAVAWMLDEGHVGGGAEPPPRSLASRVKGPLLRAGVRLLPGRRRR